MTQTFEEKVTEARTYERALSDWYQRKFGAHVLPTYDYSGLQENKAPKLICQNSGLVIPDLLVCGNGRTTWVECKWKTHADLHRKTGHLVTGVNARHFSHYQQVKTISGRCVYLMFLHVKEQEVRGAELDSLMETIHHTYDGDKMGYSGMVFWNWNDLKKWCNLEELLSPPASLANDAGV